MLSRSSCVELDFLTSMLKLTVSTNCLVYGLRLAVGGLGLRVREYRLLALLVGGVGFGVWGLGFGVWGLGLSVGGLDVRVGGEHKPQRESQGT
jgi:hypothetical protein